MEHAPAAAGFDLERFLGTWHIVITNYGFWKRRTHPTVTYERLPDAGRVALRDTLRFRKRPLWGGAPRAGVLAGVDVQDPAQPARFLWRGDGLLRVIKSPWLVVAVGDDYDWAVTWFARSNVGTAAGMDLYARAPRIDPERARAILQRVREDQFMCAQARGLFATVQEGVPADHYRDLNPTD